MFSLTTKLCTIIHTTQSTNTITHPLIIGQDIMQVSVWCSYTICHVVLDHSRALIGTAQIGVGLGPKPNLFMVDTRFSFQILAQAFGLRHTQNMHALPFFGLLFLMGTIQSLALKNLSINKILLNIKELKSY